MNAGRRPHLVAPLFVATVALLGASPARADATKERCVAANAQAQKLRHAGKLIEARGQLRACADPACPAMVRNDCTTRIDELEKVLPTVVFDAKDSDGRDVSPVQITVDAQPLVDHLDGTPIRIDPGEHTFVFSSTGHAAVTRKLLLVEGDKGRRERVTFESLTPAPAAVAAKDAPPPPTPPAAQSEGGLTTLQILGLSAGGVGVAGLVVGGVFGVLTGSEWNKQKTDCASPSSCANYTQAVSDHSSIQSDSTLATTAFIAGGALLAGGAALFFWGGRSAESASAQASGLVFVPSAGPSGAALSIHGGF